MNCKIFSKLILALCLSTGAYAGTGPDKPAPAHPHYRHALSNLRAARWMIDNRPGNWQESVEEVEAVTRIDAAVAAIRKAAIDDGKSLRHHPKVKEPRDHGSRLRSAVVYLKKARVNISLDKDKALVQNLRLRAYEQIDAALKALRKVIHPEA